MKVVINKIALLIALGTFFSSTTYADDKYELPQAIYEGHWAGLQDYDGDYGVTSFKGKTVTNYNFKCLEDGTFIQLNKSVDTLVPHDNAMWVEGRYESWIKVKTIHPQKILRLWQSFDDTFNDDKPGVLYRYKNVQKIAPLCPQQVVIEKK